MHLERIVLRGFRNLRDLDLTLPPEGAVLLGPNAQGKTNFLEAVGYPVLFRALRGAPDSEVAAFGGPGFRLEAAFAEAGRTRTADVTYTAASRKKRIALDDAPVARLSEAVGAWVAVAFLPRDVALAGGAAPERRQYLDRMLSLASADHLRALARYRTALSQRNAALRAGQEAVARAFDAPLAEAGAVVMQARLGWISTAAPRFAEGFAALGEPGTAELGYRGDAALAEAGGWTEALERARGRDMARRMTTVGPHRDDLVLTVGGRGRSGISAPPDSCAAPPWRCGFWNWTPSRRRAACPPPSCSTTCSPNWTPTGRRASRTGCWPAARPGVHHRPAARRTARGAGTAGLVGEPGRGDGGRMTRGMRPVTKKRPLAPLAQVLEEYLAASGLDKGVERAEVVQRWAELVGPQIAAVTQAESVTADGVLRVRVATAPWATELSLMTPRILARMNAGRQGRINEIRWITGPLGRPL